MRGVFNKTENERHLLRAFRASFLETEEGLDVLDFLLRELGFFSEAETEEDRIKRNIGIKILMWCGIWNQPNTMEILLKLKEVPNPLDPEFGKGSYFALQKRGKDRLPQERR